MANHGYIISKKHFKEEQVFNHLIEINERRFKGLFKIEASSYGNAGAWFINYTEPNKNYPIGFNIWISSKRTIEHRHTQGFARYAEMVFTEELATIYNAKLGDDGCQERFDPNLSKLSSYEIYLNSYFPYEHYFNLKWLDIVPTAFKNM